MSDRGFNLFAAIVGIAMALLLTVILAFHVQPSYLVQQNDFTVPASQAFEGIELLTSTGQPLSNEVVRIALDERLAVRPYDEAARETAWRFTGNDPGFAVTEYVCRLDYRLVYTVFLLGVPVYDGDVAGYELSWALVDAHVSSGQSGAWNPVRMPGEIVLKWDNSSLPTYG